MQDTPQLATLHYHQAVLEMETKQAVASTSFLAQQDLSTPASPAQTAHKAVWKALTHFAELAEIIEVDIEHTYTNTSPVADRSHRVLMYHKLLIRVYGVFPRALLLDDATHRCSASWLDSALPMAAHAIKLYHICLMQFGWLGDCILDAQHFIELLCR